MVRLACRSPTGRSPRHRLETQRRCPAAWAGFTLVELLIVIVIIAILMALLIPAVQGVRESARRVQCSNHVRQMALATDSHLHSFGIFPDGGDNCWVPRSWIEQPSGNSPGSPQLAPLQAWGWAYQILPFMEQQAAWALPSDAAVAATLIPLHYCPTRRAPALVENTAPNGPNWSWGRRGMLDYAANGGRDCTNVAGWGIYGDASTGPIVRRGRGLVRPATIKDGLSNTMLLGEKWLNVAYAGTVHMGDDDNGFASGWDFDNVRWACFPPERDVNDPNMKLHYGGGQAYAPQRGGFGSSHPGSFTIALCDGSVRPIDYEVDFTVFRAISHRSDGQAITLP